DRDLVLAGHHRPDVEEAPLPYSKVALLDDRDPAARLEQGAPADLEAGVVERLEHVPLHRKPHEELAAHRVQVDARLAPGERVALVPAPLLGEELRLRVVHAAAGTLRGREGARRLGRAGSTMPERK